MNKHKLNQRLFLRETPTSSVFELFHKFTENILFSRWIFFKNRPRSTSLLIRAALVNTIIFGTYYALFSNIQFLFMGIDVDPILLYSLGCIVGYFCMSWTFAGKCNYTSTMYNDIVKEQGQGNDKVVKMLSCNFVAQLLIMDLWAHRLYSWVVIDTFTEAVKWNLANTENSKFKNWEEFVETANSGKLEIAIIRNIVIDYQIHLAEHTDSHNSIEAA